MAQADSEDDVVVIKCVLLVAMLILTGISVALPIGMMQIRRVKNSEATRRKFILSVMNCFAGGIFVATGLLHLLPEVIENMDTAFEELDIGDQDYPFACFVVCLGFLMVLIIEHIVLSFVRNEAVTDSELTDPSCHCKNNIRSGLPGVAASGIFSQSTGIKSPTTVHHDGSFPGSSQKGHDNVSSPPPSNAATADTSGGRQETIKLLENKISSQEESYSEIEDAQAMKRGTLHALSVAFALSIHSMFEGLAFGLQDTINDTLQIFLAIILHKIVLAFSLGINFITVQVPWKTGLLLAIIFCLASPIGGGIGTGLVASNSESAALTLLDAILTGLATGTFLYVAFVEVISYELSNIEKKYAAYRLLLVLSIVIGFTTFAGLAFIHDHDHDHGDDHGHDHDHDNHDH